MNNNLNSNNIDANLNPDLNSNTNPDLNNLNPNTNLGINSNLTLNATNSIIVQYQEGTMENLISSTNDNFNYNLNDLGSVSGNLLNLATISKNNQESTNPNNNHQELQYLKILSNLSQTNPNKITLDKVANISQQWDQTSRGLTTTSQVAIAVAAVSVAIASGGIGSGISGAMMTAAATSASTTATISATNASMNTDSNFLNSTKSIADNSWKSTTSDESLKNMAISAAVAGVASWAVQASGGNPNLEAGTRADSKVGVNTVKGSDGTIYLEKVGEPGIQGVELTAKEMESYNSFGGFGSPYNNNPIFQTVNQIPSAPSGAAGHDAWVDANHFGLGVTASTAAPYLIINACAAAPSLCAIYVNTRTDKNFLQSSNSKY